MPESSEGSKATSTAPDGKRLRVRRSKSFLASRPLVQPEGDPIPVPNQKTDSNSSKPNNPSEAQQQKQQQQPQPQYRNPRRTYRLKVPTLDGIPRYNADMFPAVSAGHPLDLNHLWQQVQELSAVLAANRENTVGLVRKANELRNYTAGAVPGAEATDNVVNGNVAIPSQRELELAEENRQLRQEVAGLRTENEDLGLLVQDYETVLEKVLEGLRVYAHEHSLATINIHSSYTNQLANERAANAALRQREIDTQARLTNLSTWLREAYAHATELEPDIIIEQYKAENAALREALGINDEPDSSEEGE